MGALRWNTAVVVPLIQISGAFHAGTCSTTARVLRGTSRYVERCQPSVLHMPPVRGTALLYVYCSIIEETTD